MTAQLRVVVVEDSATQRAVLVRVLEAAGDVRVVATAADTEEAVAVVARERPDAVTMDLQIPGAGGLDAIARIMVASPVPILVLSSLVADRAGAVAASALSAGAAVVMPKPGVWGASDVAELRRTLRLLSSLPVVRRRGIAPARVAAPAERPRPAVGGVGRRGISVIALGASTGGPEALATVIRGIAGVPVPILCVQHIHATFAAGFATWLRDTSGVPVTVVEDGSPLAPGVVHLPPADLHLRLTRDGRASLAAEPATLHRPSVDELFSSVARHSGSAARAALLSGMGEDGARGLLEISEASGHTIAQDRATCVVYGMPGTAERLGAARQILPINEIARSLLAGLLEVAA